ncbi:MAG TPA: CPBP family glutamic-type intramembrane protease [Lachnospiraceae bacterium]|nr:CPBP family glutamic-type intramembrane protease [Lachnospiraceae bacterium]HPF28574.1 CPBP family glutamic-type intramembrane protease [Lachnospiraceae bacterium]
MKKSGVTILWIWFVIFGIIIAFVTMISKDGDEVNSIAWLVLEGFVLVLDIILLVKNKLPKRESILAAVILALLVLASYVDVSVLGNHPVWFNLIVDPLLTLMSSLVCFRVFEKYPQKTGRIFRKHEAESILISILIGCVAGLIWGIINIMLMMGSNQSQLNFSIHSILVALSPAIFEEIALRTVFWAFYLEAVKGAETTRLQKFTCMFMMILPHVLIHTPNVFVNQGIVNGLISIGLYVVLFGIVFAFLQKKRDLASAMIAHGAVDLMRFCFFGLPL